MPWQIKQEKLLVPKQRLKKWKLAAQAEAERIENSVRQMLKRIAKVGQAEAESREKMAIALTKLNEAGILMEFIKSIAWNCKEVNAPLSNIDKVVSFGGNDGLHDMGRSRLARTFDNYQRETTGPIYSISINQNHALPKTRKQRVVAAIESQKPVEKSTRHRQWHPTNRITQTTHSNDAFLLRITTSGLRSKAELMMSSDEQSEGSNLEKIFYGWLKEWNASST